MSSVEVVSSSCVKYVEHLCLENYLYFIRNVSESNLNGSFWNKVSTFLLSDWLNEKEHAVNLNKMLRTTSVSRFYGEADGISLRLTNGWKVEQLQRVNGSVELT